MTARKDLKRRVRDRQARTGESYTTARRHVVAQIDPAFPVVELDDLTALARGVDLRGEVRAFPEVTAAAEPEVVLTRLRDVLRATPGDPGMATLRAILVDGFVPPLRERSIASLAEEGLRFATRVGAGLAGPSDSGRLLAIDVDGRAGRAMVIATVWPLPFLGVLHRSPMVILTTAAALSLSPALVTARIPSVRTAARRR